MAKKRRFLTLYHGTSTRFLPDIEAGGLKDAALTDLEDMASYFAQEAAGMSGGTPIILKVRIVRPQSLRPDHAMYREPLTFVKEKHGIDTDDEWAQAFQEGHLRYPKDERDWKTALKVVSTVIHDGLILPKDIIDVREVEVFEDI